MVGNPEVAQFSIVVGKQPSRPLMMFDVTINPDYGREAHLYEAAIAAGAARGIRVKGSVHR
jgi:hypothetical protein